MENINEFKDINNEKISFSEKIKQIKLNNPGKFDHLPDPKPGNAFRYWSKEEVEDFKKLLNKKDESN